MPDFVLEITSSSTWEEDQGHKRELYRRLGVTEYWQYDPERLLRGAEHGTEQVVVGRGISPLPS